MGIWGVFHFTREALAIQSINGRHTLCVEPSMGNIKKVKLVDKTHRFGVYSN